MIMKKKHIMTFVLATGMLSALISCDSDLAVSRQTGDNGSTTFSAIMNSDLQSDTRTSLQGLSTIWSAGDEIKVNGTDITISQGEGTRYGVFQGTVSDYSGGYYAGYPASATTFSTGTMTLAIPASQTYNASNPLLGQMPMAAYATADANGNVALNFMNAANILKLNLWGESGTNVKQIVISSSSAALSGKLTVNTSTTPISFGGITENQGTSVTLTCTEAVTLSTDQNAPTPFYVILPKLSGDANLTVKIYNSNGQYQQSTITVDGEHNVQLKGNANRLFATASKKFIPGALNGVFSVSATQTVRFSQGNVMYQASTNTWKMADNQYDYIGNNAGNNISTGRDSQSDWIDLISWAATGYNIYCVGPTSLEAVSDKYKTKETASTYETLTIDNKADWGYCFGEATSIWRTLSYPEFNYLLNDRTVNGGTKEGKSYQRATVNSKYGLIIYPDNYTSQTGATSYSSAEWTTMETAGCVFLPAACNRVTGANVQNTNEGFYWTSTGDYGTEYNAFYLKFSESGVELGGRGRSGGSAVRLVTNAQ